MNAGARKVSLINTFVRLSGKQHYGHKILDMKFYKRHSGHEIIKINYVNSTKKNFLHGRVFSVCASCGG